MFRIGIGHDTHRLGEGRSLVIGGVAIPHHLGAVAHSDGDVLLHAITDALLGALNWGDIGEWFPDTDPQHAGADSRELLKRVVSKVREGGWQVVNLDSIVFAQHPKLVPFKLDMRRCIAGILEIEENCVSVKAKTGEKVGPVGREEALCAEAVILLQKRS